MSAAAAASILTLGCGPDFQASAGADGGGSAGSGADGDAASEETPDLFVDPAKGQDTNDGTEVAPFRTLKKALHAARRGQTIRLLPGTYEAMAGEDWLTPVPAGARIVSVLPGEAILLGTHQDTALRCEGDSDVRGLVLKGFGKALTAETGHHVWADLELVDNVTGVALAGDAQVSATGLDVSSQAAGAVAGFQLRGSSALHLYDSTLHDLGTGCGLGDVGIVSEAATFQGIGLNLHDAEGALHAEGAGQIILSETSLHEVGGAGCGNGEAIDVRDAAGLSLSTVLITGARGEGVLVRDVARATISGGAIETSDRPGVLVEGGSITLDGTTFQAWKAEAGALVAMQGGAIFASEPTFFGCGLCAVAAGGSVGLRGAVFMGAGTAVFLRSGSVDLGTADDPGGNDFTQVSNTGLRVQAAGPLSIAAAGNAWIQTPGAMFPSYLPGLTLTGPLGCDAPAPRNLCLAHVGVSVSF
jgi:hypothetical protein